MDIEEIKAAIRDCGYEVHELEMENAKRYTLAEAAQALGLADMSVLFYVHYAKTLPTREDEKGDFYLLEEDLQEYRVKHQSQAFRRGKAKIKQ